MSLKTDLPRKWPKSHRIFVGIMLLYSQILKANAFLDIAIRWNFSGSIAMKAQPKSLCYGKYREYFECKWVICKMIFDFKLNRQGVQLDWLYSA
jgi:hypothetical protein